MEFASPILDVASRLWDCTAKRAAYLTDLPETLDSLRNAMKELKDVAEDVKTKVDRAEENREVRRTHEVAGWLDRVQVLERKVTAILQKGDQEIQQKCLGTCCPKNCRSGYKIGKLASKKLDAVTELMDKRSFRDLIDRLPGAAVDERPMEETGGLDRIYAEVCRCIQDEELGIIGLYGMGGAGKTTLMTKVNNEFIIASKVFKIAIWVEVPRRASVGKVQEVIRNKLDIPEDRWRNRTEDEKKQEIFIILKEKRFVMLLDNVWERLDLQKVGVPSPNSQNKSKVILTSRSLDVCRDMEAHISLKVECLTQDEAINLFKKKVGEATLNSHPGIPRLAEIAANECQGLPLALVTIGRAMTGKNTPREWVQAIQMLKNHPAKFRGMEDHVFRILKLSYDNLQNDTYKACFLYLAVFPKDYKIGNKNLIDLWIGEEFFDKFARKDEAFNEGCHIIEHLKTACLFESDEYDRVKMHDVVHDMASWLLSKEVDTVKNHRGSKWKKAQQIDLLKGSVEEFIVPTFFTFSSGFFHFMLLFFGVVFICK